jgi:hypothetical protein
VVAAALRGRELVIANVGDSRAYHWRDGQLRQVTRDHSLVQQLQDEGQLSTEEAQSFRRRNVILRSVGADDYIEVDLFHSEARPGDRLLLCSDGLHKYFPDLEELGRMASAQPPQEAVHTLVQAANTRGGSDNISVVIVALREPQTRRVASQARPAVAAPNWDELPTGPRPLRAGSAAGAAAIGSSARPQQVALLISLLVLSLMMVVAGILVARQVFAPAVVPTDAPTQPPPATSVPVMATAAPSEAAAPTVTLVTEMPPTQAPTLPPALTDTGSVPTVVPATAQAPTSPALTVDWSDGTLCEWTVAPGDNLHQLYSRLAGLAPAGGSSPEAFVARVVQANPALDPASGGNPDRLDVGQKILIPWPAGLSPLADGSPPICPAL